MGKQVQRLVRQGWLWCLLLLAACSEEPPPAMISSVILSDTPTATIDFMARANDLATLDYARWRQTATPSPTPTVTATPTTPPFAGVIPTIAQPVNVSNAPVPVVINDAYNGTVQHEVTSGESLMMIANRYGVTLNQLLSANNLRTAEIIVPEQRLRVPIPTQTPQPSATWDQAQIGILSPNTVGTARALQLPQTVNDLAYEGFFNPSDDVIRHMQVTYLYGQSLGRNPRAFTRVGDSTIEPPHFFYRFDETDYHLGDYSYLQRTIDYYRGSFGHNSVAVQRGLHAWSVFDPMWSPPPCANGEHMLACEFRLHNPSMVIIRIGTNDAAAGDLTRDAYEDMVTYALDQGVIPILGTKADRFDGYNNPVNRMIREVADKYLVPLWDFDRVAATIPTRGLGSDNVHLSIFWSHDWREARGFTTGHGLHNLTGLIVLDEVRQVLNHVD